MAYSESNLYLQSPENIRYQGQQTNFFWSYYSPVDSIAVVTAPGYISNGVLIPMFIGDMVWVYDLLNNAVSICYVVSVTGEAVNLAVVSGGTPTPPAGNVLLDQSGNPLLDQNGNPLLDQS